MTTMKKPKEQGDVFLAAVATTKTGGGFALWWLGQSGFLLRYGDEFLLFDPYLSDSLTRKYAGTDKPHVRMTELVVAPERLDFIHTVTSSHNHTDHLDADTLGPLMEVNPGIRLVVPEANRMFVAERLGIAPDTPIGLDAGQSVEVGPFELDAVAAAHETVEKDAAGRCRFLGYVARFGRWSVYHSGDTVLYDGLIDALEPLKVDVAILPINGRKPERRVAGNLSGAEAAQLARAIGAKLVIPCHYDMFAFNTETPDEFVAACEALSQPYRVLENGEAVLWAEGEGADPEPSP